MKLQHLFVLFLFSAISRTVVGQERDNPSHALFGSVQIVNYQDPYPNTVHTNLLGMGIEYRSVIDSMVNDFHISLGAGFETIPLKTIGPNDGYFTTTHYNLTVPLGIYHSFAKSFYIGLFASLDFPFGQKSQTENQGMMVTYSEFDFRFLNINLSSGLNLGKSISIANRTMYVEIQGKLLGILGNKTNDYWHYPEEALPYYGGVNVGFGF